MTSTGDNSTKTTFWTHVEVLRGVIVRIVTVVLLLSTLLFCFKDFMFNKIVLAPCHDDFYTYRLLCILAQKTHTESLCIHPNSPSLINTELSSQLLTHISISFYIAIVIALPYIVSEIWLFTRPALYKKEKKAAFTTICAFVLLFFTGVLLAYFIIFPILYNFMANYQVSQEVNNLISLNSYIGSFTGTILMMGASFEIPIVVYFFCKIGILQASLLSRQRKVAIVAVLVLAAFITPSTDIVSMLLVALPLYGLYEISIAVARHVEKNNQNTLKTPLK